MSAFTTTYVVQIDPYPAIVKKTFDSAGTVISSARVTYSEAVAAGVNIDDYLSAYKSFLIAYADAMTEPFLEEIHQIDSHKNVRQAVEIFNLFIRTTPRHRE